MRGKFIVLFLLFSGTSVIAQNKIDYSFGEGLRLLSRDSLFHIKFSARIQSRYDGHADIINDELANYENAIYIRRSRLKFKGGAFKDKLKFKFEYDVVNAELLDAVIKWNFWKNFSLWVGQTKLPGNRERVISSQKLQFVDRSLLNGKLNIDRDKGVQLHHHFNIGKVTVREAVSISAGEGRNTKLMTSGNAYTGRVEILPFGVFTRKGDYFGSDLAREQKPKLSVGATYDYNQNAQRERDRLGEFLSEKRNLSTVFADMMFKFRGFSLMVEYADKITESRVPLVSDSTGTITGSFYTGQSYNLQAGYLFKSNWELAARYTNVKPKAATTYPELNEYTLGISKYIVGHNLKVQSDVSLLDEAGGRQSFIFRLQTEFSL